MEKQYYRYVPCEECSRLAWDYRNAVRLYRDAVEVVTGSLTYDALLVREKTELLHRKCMIASDDFLNHVKARHPAAPASPARKPPMSVRGYGEPKNRAG